MTGDDLIRLRPSQPTGEPAVNGPDMLDFDVYLMARRQALAEELRTVEEICIRRRLITRLLCAPGRDR
jgi:hypothetical protein